MSPNHPEADHLNREKQSDWIRSTAVVVPNKLRPAEGRAEFRLSNNSCQPAQCEACRAANRRDDTTKMNANSNPLPIPRFVVLLLLILALVGTTTASTLLITGHSRNNFYKHALARQFVDDYDRILTDKENLPDFVVLNSGKPLLEEEDPNFIQSFPDIQLDGNVTTLVLSRLGTNQMSLGHIQIIYDYIKIDQELLVVEIGETAIQTRALLDKGAFCWAEGKAMIGSLNTVFLCNGMQPETVSAVIQIADLRASGFDMVVPLDVQTPSLWPSIFASAAKTEKRNKRKNVEVQVDEEEHQDQEDEDENSEPEAHNKPGSDRTLAQKLDCKYRKTCYETGEKPEIPEMDFNFWSFSSSDDENEDAEEQEEDSDEEPDITALKLKCKYRASCYKEKNIPLSEKDKESLEQKKAEAEESTVPKPKKRTLKDIAERTMKNVKEAEEKAAARPLSKSVIVERKLQDIEDKLQEKLDCKYRKSCYETGKVPEIETWSFKIPFYSSDEDEQQKPEKKEVVFSELEEDEQKFYCKYRKSCYSTGIKPEIDNEFHFSSIEDIKAIPEVIETRKLTLQERCKYRKSCYETGVLPEINPQQEIVVQKEVSHVIPSSMHDLKFLCKYRKSCYQEVAQSATVDTIMSIRQRRIAEKEAHKKLLRRAKRRRFRGSVDRGMLKQTKRTKEKQEDKPKKEEERPIKEKKRSKKEKKQEQREVVEPVEERIPEPVVEPIVEEEEIKKEEAVEETPTPKKKKSKKQKHAVPVIFEESPVEPEEPQIEEPVAEQTVQEEQEEPIVEKKKEKKSKKRGKKHEEEEKSEERHVPPVAPTPDPKVDDSELDLESRQKQRDYCKYRKSCYESGEKPEVAQTVETLLSGFTSHVNKEYEKESSAPKTETEEKLECKYRKSCYETGVLPDLSVNIQPDAEKPSFKEISSGMSKKLICKYRKSCYEEMGINDDSDKVTVTEEARKPAMKTVVHEPKTKTVLDKKDDTSSEEEEKDNEEDKESEKNLHQPVIDEHEKLLSVEEKLDCKYRRSCYGTIPPRAKKEDHSGSMAREGGSPLRAKCHKYYLSCREQLGLPVKEKAPMGPNGRRLCRKKKE